MGKDNVVAVEDKKPSFGAKVKEFFRKTMVSLKRKPQNIAFLCLFVTTAFNLLVLGTYSQAAAAASSVDWIGLMVFANTLFSLLILVCFMNSFPKMKKPPKLVKDKNGQVLKDENGNEVKKEDKKVITIHFTKASKININLLMLGVFLVFGIIMIVCEGMYYSKMSAFWDESYGSLSDMSATVAEQSNNVRASLTYSIVHIVLLVIDIILTLLTPVIGKLLAKVNTNKELDSAVSNMQEIDLATEE